MTMEGLLVSSPDRILPHVEDLMADGMTTDAMIVEALAGMGTVVTEGFPTDGAEAILTEGVNTGDDRDEATTY